MRQSDKRLRNMEFKDRAASYRSRPVADIQSRYRTANIHHNSQPLQVPTLDAVVSTHRPAVVHEKPQQHIPPKQKYNQDIIRAKPQVMPQRLGITQTTVQVSPEFSKRRHRTIASVPTLPAPKRSRLHRTVMHIRTASPNKKRGYALIVLAATLFIIGVGVNINSLLVTKKIEAQSANIDSSGGNGTAGENGRPGASAGLSEEQPDATAVKKYTVAPDMPKYINISSLGVFARVVRVGVDTNSQIGTPRNVFDTAWYDGSSKPGQPGAAFIDGHVLGPTRGGIFAGLKNIKVGAKVVVTLGDNSTITYRVAATEKVDADKVDMQKALRSYDSTKQGLNLMTCNGTYLRDKESFDKRFIVYTVREN